MRRQRIRITRLVAMTLLLASLHAGAVVIRDDVPDASHRMAVSAFPALADLPGEGHGVLIAPQWVVTAAHAVSAHPPPGVVVVGGTPRAVDRVVVHPGFKSPPGGMVEKALASGDWEAFFAFMETVDDLALVRLAEPVVDVAPAPIFRGQAQGRTVRIMGRGATGTGTAGHPLHASRRTDLRDGYNQVSLAEGRWLAYRFDAPPDAHPREATTGSGDSGGPVLVAVGDQWQLAGIAAWKRGEVVGTEVRPGRYGELSYGVRLGHYDAWIRSTMAQHDGKQVRAGTATFP